MSVAKRDFADTAAGTTRIVPKGVANTINGYTDKDGVRATGVWFEEITDGSFEGAIVKLKGKLTHAENSVIFKLGDRSDRQTPRGRTDYPIRRPV